MFAGFLYAVTRTENGKTVSVDRFRDPAAAHAKLVELEGENSADVMDGFVTFAISQVSADVYA